MTDPAVEAAQRAWPKGNGARKIVGNRPRSYMDAAAREALQPIRELHRLFVVRTPDDESWHECETCHGNVWPCATARLVYTSEELGGAR